MTRERVEPRYVLWAGLKWGELHPFAAPDDKLKKERESFFSDVRHSRYGVRRDGLVWQPVHVGSYLGGLGVIITELPALGDYHDAMPDGSVYPVGLEAEASAVLATVTKTLEKLGCKATPKLRHFVDHVIEPPPVSID